MKLSIVLTSLLVLSTSAFAGGSDTGSAGISKVGSCSTNANDVTALIDIERSIDTSLDELMTLRNNSQDKEQINYYQVQIGSLRAEYLKCDLFLTHALLNNK